MQEIIGISIVNSVMLKIKILIILENLNYIILVSNARFARLWNVFF